MSVSGKTGVQVLVKHKQASDVSLAVSLVGVVYLLEVGSLRTVIRLSWFYCWKLFFLLRCTQIRGMGSIRYLDVNNDFYGIFIPGSSLIRVEKLAATLAKILLACELASLLTSQL